MPSRVWRESCRSQSSVMALSSSGRSQERPRRTGESSVERKNLHTQWASARAKRHVGTACVVMVQWFHIRSASGGPGFKSKSVLAKAAMLPSNK